MDVMRDAPEMTDEALIRMAGACGVDGVEGPSG